MRFLLGMFLIFSQTFVLLAQPTHADINRVMAEINLLRTSGCSCGGRKMRPVKPVIWDQRLYQVSRRYALYMERHNHFDHRSLEGQDLGDRLEAIGYNWQKVGENLGFGYDDFYSVLEAWKKSPSHCRMLMDPDVTHMGLSKRGVYWAQSFSRPMEEYLADHDVATYD